MAIEPRGGLPVPHHLPGTRLRVGRRMITINPLSNKPGAAQYGWTFAGVATYDL
jgi:hypothetical protein